MSRKPRRAANQGAVEVAREDSDHALAHVLSRNMLLVGGKGGVGKTVISLAVARTHAARGARTLWVEFENPLMEPGEHVEYEPNLWRLNVEGATAFQEYVELKIGIATLARFFVQNKLINYMAKAAPGIHELVLLGKTWHQLKEFDHVIVDMPSTGYELAMFHSTRNFANLFKGGPIHRDALAMLETFADATQTGHLIVGLPEEMPLIEGLELNGYLTDLFPENPAAFIVNRCFPDLTAEKGYSDDELEEMNPIPETRLEYAIRRSFLERKNLKIWREKKIRFGELDYVPPPLGSNGRDAERARSTVAAALAEQMLERGYLPGSRK